MFDWRFLKKNPAREFEFLICDFLRTKYSEFDWNVTETGNDGNRDVVGISKNSQGQHWAEAKFITKSEKLSKNLSSRRYDSTLVTAFLEEISIVAVHFGTNANFSNSFILRSLQYTSSISIRNSYYLDRNCLEWWLFENPKIALKYFGIQLEKPSEPSIKIEEIYWFKKIDSNKLVAIEPSTLYNSIRYLCRLVIKIKNIEPIEAKLVLNDKVIEVLQLTNGIIVNSSLDSFDFIKNENKVELISCCSNEILDSKIIFMKLSASQLTVDQLKIIEEYKQKVETFSVFNIYGKKNLGKSFLLETIVDELLLEYTVISLNFKGNDEDILEICNLIFILTLSYDCNHVLNLIHQKKEKKLNFEYIPESFIKKICLLIRSELYSEIAIQLELYAQNNSIFNKSQLNKICIVIKNYHYTSYQLIINYLFTFYQTGKGVSILLESRKKQENFSYCPITSRKLEHITDVDITHFFRDWRDMDQYQEFSNLLSACILSYYKTPLDLINLKDKLVNHEPRFSNLSEMCEFIMINTRKINLNDSEKILLFCIGKINKEISLEHFTFSEQKTLKNLFDAKYITIENKEVTLIKKTIIETTATIVTKSIKLFQRLFETSNDINLIYEILKLDTHYWYLYKEVVLEYSDTCYKKNYYNEDLKGYELYVSFLKNNTYRIVSSDINSIYNYAECLNHVVSLNRSFEEQSFAYTIAKELRNKPLELKIHSEILSLSYWKMVNSKKLLDNILEFIEEVIEYKKTISGTSALKSLNRGLETAYNRYMVTSLLDDDFINAKIWLNKNKLIAIEHNAHHHLGYSFMDYAKGIYHLNLKKSLVYLKKALAIFFKCGKKELRRYLDCNCEIEYIKCLIDSTLSMEEFNLAKQDLLNNQFIVQYYKAELKEVALLLIKGNDSKKIQKILENPSLIKYLGNTTRGLYLIKHLESATQYSMKNNSYKEVVSETKLLLQDFDNSYQKIVLNNQKILNYSLEFSIFNVKNVKEDTFFMLDPRIW
ncbi:hypothetical protein [Carnobacterium divergens]|uniref:hypothetical protein n=1 Tax=Carnobacterium divergens TaxID=2748 RepID=UPI001071B787|nr:hypothetical protein [Carnobacterium divergens]TFI75669.1 hypothetical protein CKN81_02240 [Carnobacterium divergens]